MSRTRKSKSVGAGRGAERVGALLVGAGHVHADILAGEEADGAVDGEREGEGRRRQPRDGRERRL